MLSWSKQMEWGWEGRERRQKPAHRVCQCSKCTQNGSMQDISIILFWFGKRDEDGGNVRLKEDFNSWGVTGKHKYMFRNSKRSTSIWFLINTRFTATNVTYHWWWPWPPGWGGIGQVSLLSSDSSPTPPSSLLSSEWSSLWTAHA